MHVCVSLLSVSACWNWWVLDTYSLLKKSLLIMIFIYINFSLCGLHFILFGMHEARKFRPATTCAFPVMQTGSARPQSQHAIFILYFTFLCPMNAPLHHWKFLVCGNFMIHETCPELTDTGFGLFTDFLSFRSVPFSSSEFLFPTVENGIPLSFVSNWELSL